MQTVWWERLLGLFRVQWRKYKTTAIALVVCLIVGIVLGIVTLFVTNVGADEINTNLIDGNILNATAINSSLGGFIWQRILAIMVPVLVVLLFACISKPTALIAFLVMMMHGYWFAVAAWWVFFYYNWTALLVLVFYVVWLLLVTTVILAGMLWALQCGENFRTNQRCGQGRNWLGLLRGFACLVAVAVVLGFIEYLVFWTILGKVVYKPH